MLTKWHDNDLYINSTYVLASNINFERIKHSGSDIIYYVFSLFVIELYVVVSISGNILFPRFRILLGSQCLTHDSWDITNFLLSLISSIEANIVIHVLQHSFYEPIHYVLPHNKKKSTIYSILHAF